MVSVQTRAQYAAHEDTLLAVQLELLGAISQNNERKPSSLDVGAQLLEDELCRISKNENDAPRRVLLIIDNVPEGGSGIGELLPQDLQGCLADGSRVLFTSRNKAAQGLRLATDDVIKYHVECLTDEASRRVLLAGLTAKRVLDDAQLQVALDFCKGLPLALKLLNRALLAEEDPKYLIKHMATHGSFSVDKEDELVSALRFSVECLSEELQIAWLDLTWIYSQGAVPLLELQCVFGEHTLQKLLDRSLITLSHMDVPGFTEQQVVAVRLHDLLLKMAECIYGPQGKIQCFTRLTRRHVLACGGRRRRKVSIWIPAVLAALLLSASCHP